MPLYLVFQALATAALMVLVRRGGRNADAAISRQLQLEQDLKVEAARRADQREQDRRLHDTILSTLTMVASGALDMSSPVLAAQASRDLQVLHSWPTLPEPGPPDAVALPDRLAAVAAGAAPLRVSTSFLSATKTVPATAVDRIADCAAEALRNVARHAGTDTAELRVLGGNGQVVVEIVDHGRRPVRAPLAARDLQSSRPDGGDRRHWPSWACSSQLEGLAMFAVLARDGLHQPNVAAFITVLAGSTGIQVALSVAARTLHVPAQQAEEAATREAEATARQAVADRIRATRRARWLELRATAEPLLSGLAAGTADPADLAVQRACAVEAARLRRLFAEADETPDPLVHELHACADVAQRRGVAVDIETAAPFPGTGLPGSGP